MQWLSSPQTIAPCGREGQAIFVGAYERPRLAVNDKAVREGDVPIGIDVGKLPFEIDGHPAPARKVSIGVANDSPRNLRGGRGKAGVKVKSCPPGVFDEAFRHRITRGGTVVLGPGEIDRVAAGLGAGDVASLDLDRNR